MASVQNENEDDDESSFYESSCSESNLNEEDAVMLHKCAASYAARPLPGPAPKAPPSLEKVKTIDNYNMVQQNRVSEGKSQKKQERQELDLEVPSASFPRAPSEIEPSPQFQL